jgi:predicted phage terminase large subunit-like protein
MSFELTKRQDQAMDVLTGPAKHCMLFGGARSGKTFLLARAIAVRALKAQKSRHAVLRYRFNHVKSSIWHDTWPKMMELCFPGVSYRSDRSDWFIEMPNGSTVWFGGLDDKERTEKILGQEYATIFLNECSQISYASRETVRTRLAQNIGLSLKLYYDENPPLKTHWTHRIFIEKKHPDPPYRRLDDPKNYDSMLLNPADNVDNLPESYLTELQTLSSRARLRFWEGRFGDASEGALWDYETIDRHRVNKAPQNLLKVIVAVDPSGTKGEEDERSDFVGIVVVGLGFDGSAYVLEDLTCKAPPAVWGRVAVNAYDRHAANVVIGETNFGGAMVEHVIKAAAAAVNLTVPYREVTATRGKQIRAEPVSTLYEQGKVHHVGQFDELEDQLCSFTTAGYMGDRSPDRADALVWGLTELFPGLTRRGDASTKHLQKQANVGFEKVKTMQHGNWSGRQQVANTKREQVDRSRDRRL